MFKKINHKIICLSLILIFSLWSWQNLTLPGFFSMHDDMQFMRIYQLDKCIKDGQIPCRWVPDLGYGYGYPLFNYYSPFPYYLGELFHLLGFSILDSVKILFGLSLILSGIFMYFLAREFWGDLGGLIAAILYIYAPYHSVDIYVRGALAESWALVWFPLVTLGIYKVFKEEKIKWIVLLSISYGLLLLSHNIMSMLFTIFIIAWITFLLCWSPNFKKLLLTGISLFWGFLNASFFILPALFEKKYVHTETMLMGYFNYLAHFVDLKQLFINYKWGWGASVWGPDDGMPFMIGYFHWILPFTILILSFFYLRKKKSKNLWIIVFFFFAFIFSTFMTHSRSNLIWKNFKFLEYLQFPWRFLALVIFFSSFLSGAIVLFFPKFLSQKLLALVLILGIILAYFGYFRPETIYLNDNDQSRLQGERWRESQVNAIFDYLPIYAQYPPAEPAPNLPQIISGDAEIIDYQKGTNWQKAKVRAKENTQIQFPIYYFPGWQVLVDGKEVLINYNNFLGLITFELDQGFHQIELKLTNTPIRTIGNTLSCLGFFSLLSMCFYQLINFINKFLKCKKLTLKN